MDKKNNKSGQNHKSIPNFLANMSHELRNSLNNIVLYSKLLMDNRTQNLTVEQREYVDAIYCSGNSLFEFVNEILDFSKIESGEMDIKLEEIDLLSLSRDLERMYQPLARKYNIAFKVSNSYPSTFSLKTDRFRIEQILKNLVSNAFKFTEKGGISINIYSPDSTEVINLDISNQDVVAFNVRDSGIGIPNDKQDIIFESYKQAEVATHRKYGGTGLGLAICKETTQILGGDIQLESIVNKGSSFTVYLPVDSTKSVKKHAREGKASIISSKKDFKINNHQIEYSEVSNNKIKGTVLIIDDSEMLTTALKDYLKFKVTNCITAHTARESYDILESNHIDCIILDMILPDADAYDVLTHLKTQNKYQNLQIILYTGFNLSKKEEEKISKYTNTIIYKNAESYNKILNKVTSILLNS